MEENICEACISFDEYLIRQKKANMMMSELGSPPYLNLVGSFRFFAPQDQVKDYIKRENLIREYLGKIPNRFTKIDSHYDFDVWQCSKCKSIKKRPMNWST